MEEGGRGWERVGEVERGREGEGGEGEREREDPINLTDVSIHNT